MSKGKSEKREVRIVAYKRVKYDQTIEVSAEEYERLMNQESMDVTIHDPAHDVLDLHIDPMAVCDADSEYTDVEIINQ